MDDEATTEQMTTTAAPSTAPKAPTKTGISSASDRLRPP